MKTKQEWHAQVAADERFKDDPEKLAMAHEIVEADGRFNEHKFIRRCALLESIREEGKYCPHAHERKVVENTKWAPPAPDIPVVPLSDEDSGNGPPEPPPPPPGDGG